MQGLFQSLKHLQVTSTQSFQVDEFFAWFYEESQWVRYLGEMELVSIILVAVIFPLLPPIVRLSMWKLSIVMLKFIRLFVMIAIAIVRLVFFAITVLIGSPRRGIVASPGIWVFPRLFADVGIVRAHYFLQKRVVYSL